MQRGRNLWRGSAGSRYSRTCSGRCQNRSMSLSRLLQGGHVVLPGCLGGSSDEAGGRDGWAGGRQAKVVEDGLHWPGLREVGELHAAAAAGAGEHVLAE